MRTLRYPTLAALGWGTRTLRYLRLAAAQYFSARRIIAVDIDHRFCATYVATMIFRGPMAR